MKAKKLTIVGALMMLGVAFAGPTEAAVATAPALPQLAPNLSLANPQVEPAHFRRYRHCHRRVVRRCNVYGRCRVVVRNYCHRGW